VRATEAPHFQPVDRHLDDADSPKSRSAQEITRSAMLSLFCEFLETRQSIGSADCHWRISAIMSRRRDLRGFFLRARCRASRRRRDACLVARRDAAPSRSARSAHRKRNSKGPQSGPS
jgi:hypothetical protein